MHVQRAAGGRVLVRRLALVSLLGMGFGLRASSDAAGAEAGRAQQQSGSSHKVAAEINAEGYTSSRVCGECHADIYNSWKNSLHAFAIADPIFDAAYMQAIKLAGDDARRLCLRCHAPMTLTNADYELSQGVTQEGVSCDFCHTVTAVHLDKPDKPYSVAPGLVKRSVLKKAESPAHQVAYSDLHGKSEFCAGCHNYVAATGSAIMSTYAEWANGPYAGEGVQCQDCHMVRSTGKVVREDVKASGDQIHLHDLIRDTNQLRSALSVQVLRAERTPAGLEVDVQVENVGSGHMVPTGIPTREVVLTVSVESGGYTRSQERRYRKVVGDDKGRPLKRDFETLLYGSRILNDNRIAPREKRVERLRFELRQAASAKVTATLSYHYAAMILRERPLDIEMGRVDRYVK